LKILSLYFLTKVRKSQSQQRFSGYKFLLFRDFALQNPQKRTSAPLFYVNTMKINFNFGFSVDFTGFLSYNRA
jgi:hypothetical protein